VSPFDWVSELLARLQDEHVMVLRGSATELAPAHVLEIDPEDWGRAARQAAAFGCRWAGAWAEHLDDEFLISACVEKGADYLILRTRVPVATPLLPSHAPHYPGADRMERHAQDLFGVVFSDHPDPRRWVRHLAWPDRHFPLRKQFPAAGEPAGQTPPDADYRFLQVQGAGVHEIPVGPVHAGIIEPGHFRFQAVGEDVLRLEARLGYVHKGVEKIAEGRDVHGLVRLAARVSGDSCVAHAWAACMALERAAGAQVPARGLALRAIMAERERVANHLGDVGAICNDVGFGFVHVQLGRLRELWQRDSARVFGHRLMMDRVVPGGVEVDPGPREVQPLRRALPRLRAELVRLQDILEDHPSLEDRLVDTGRLAPETARSLGALGYVGRASGQGFDLRRDRPYPPYDTLEVRVPVYQEGDVAARVRVRLRETLVSLELLDRFMAGLPAGPVHAPWHAPRGEREGFGAVEGWRGEILCYLRLDAQGRIARYFPRDPSWLSWPALEHLIAGNIVPDFPVCNKSVNGSYSGQDL